MEEISDLYRWWLDLTIRMASSFWQQLECPSVEVEETVSGGDL